ncbi:MAG: hypothetical protein HY097_09910 [Nitrospinae bacterium]|nr:hypothetical protein [Nitrospinota bacterium]
MSLNKISIFSTGVIQTHKNTSAINKYNDKDFSDAFNERIKWLHNCLIVKGVPSTYDYDIEDFHQRKIDYPKAFISLQEEVFGIVVDKTEKEKFISEYYLDAAINTAHTLIAKIFKNAEVKTELYIDPEETQYKFLNISIRPKSISPDEINSILDKFDDLQEKFITTVEKKYASKITFHLDID